MNPDAYLPYPRIAMIQTTSRCNSACVMCPWPRVAKMLPQGTMDDALYGKIMDEISGHPEIEMAMPYLMNEPLMDPDLPRRIDLLKAAAPQATVYLLTNGVALDDELADRLLASKLDWIGFSVHALRPETYREITGRRDGERIIRRITDFIGRAREAGKHGNYVMVTVTRMRPRVSEKEAAEAVAYWRDQGVDPVDYQDGYISRAGNVEVFGKPEMSRPCIIGCRTVWAYRIVSILFNGDVVPCCMDWSREVIWGNLREDSIEAVWNGTRRRRFMDLIHSGLPLPPGFLCARCEDAIPAAGETACRDDDEDAASSTDDRLETTAASATEGGGDYRSSGDDRAQDAPLTDLERRAETLRRRYADFLKRQRRTVEELSRTNLIRNDR